MRCALKLLAAFAVLTAGAGCASPSKTLSFRLMATEYHPARPVADVTVVRTRGGTDSAWLLAAGRIKGEYVGRTDERGVIKDVPVRRGDVLQIYKDYFGVKQIWVGLESAAVIAVVPPPILTGPGQMPAALKRVGSIPVGSAALAEIGFNAEGEVDIWWPPAATRGGVP